MESDKDKLSQLNRHHGMTVPEGFFEEFAAKMEAALPEHPAAKAERAKTSVWMRIRPYVYMAAMFAGIWCMLNMFSILSPNTDLSIDRNPVVAEALSDDKFVDDYLIQDFDTDELLEEMYDAGLTPDQITDSTFESVDQIPL